MSAASKDSPWDLGSEAVDGRTLRFRLNMGDLPLSTVSFWNGLRAAKETTRPFRDALRDCPFAAFYWEMPALTTPRLEAPCEFVLVAAEGLARVSPDSDPFQDQWQHLEAERLAVSFANLGRDAELVAPTPRLPRTPSGDPNAAYPHLAAFARLAPWEHWAALWSAVAEAVLTSVGNRPLWVSTSGLGVYWLHVRLDTHPKYYQHIPYRAP